MNDFVKVTAAIIIEDQKVLITQRATSDEMGEKWEFPGGKIEPGETPEACLQRELHEELNIVAEVHDLYAVSKHAYPDFNIELLAYHVTIRSGRITLNTHNAYQWVSIADLNKFDFCEADKPIVKKLMNTVIASEAKQSRRFSSESFLDEIASSLRSSQ